MPKKPNADIREALMLQVSTLRKIADQIEREANELHNAKITKPTIQVIKTLADMGMASAEIAAQLGINQGRVTDVLNGNYGV